MANRKKRTQKELALLEREKQLKNCFQKNKKKQKFGLRPVLDVFAQAKNIQAFKGMPERKSLYPLFEEVRVLKKRVNRQKLQLFNEVLRSSKILFERIYAYQIFAKACRLLTQCRSLESWKMPRSKKEEVVFQSLFCHLWVAYKIPACAERVIYNLVNQYYHSDEEKRILFELASGKGIHRINNLTPTINSKGNYFFQISPIFLTTAGAIWWAKLRSMGISAPIALKIVHHFSPRISADWPDWLNDFVFFVRRNKDLNSRTLNKIMDFLFCQKGAVKQIKVKGFEETIFVPALFPAFTFNGRSLASVMRFVRQWEDFIQLAREAGTTKVFHDSKFKPMNINEGESLILIRQIKSLKGLVVEGNQMGHCVATYARYCISGESSIWSLRRISATGKSKKLLTIEVEEIKTRIETVLGKCNRAAEEKEMVWVNQWKTLNGLEMEA